MNAETPIVVVPARPHLAEARAAVLGLTAPRAAWERLAERGLIPAEWLRDPGRRFDARVLSPCSACHGSGRGLWDNRCHAAGCRFGQVDAWRTEDRPPELDLAVALAADVAGVLEAEVAARELAARLSASGVAEARFVIWRLDRSSAPLRCPAALEPALAALEVDPRAPSFLEIAAERWRTSPTRERPSPFESALRLRQTGYGLLDVASSAVTLRAPAPPG